MSIASTGRILPCMGNRSLYGCIMASVAPLLLTNIYQNHFENVCCLNFKFSDNSFCNHLAPEKYMVKCSK